MHELSLVTLVTHVLVQELSLATLVTHVFMHELSLALFQPFTTNEPRHEISNNVECATSKSSDQPAHMRSLIRAFAIRLNIL